MHFILPSGVVLVVFHQRIVTANSVYMVELAVLLMIELQAIVQSHQERL